VSDGDPVAAASVNTPDAQLLKLYEYLLARVESLENGAAIYRRGVTFDSSVSVGMPVYFDPVSGTFKKAKAAANIVDGVITTDDQAKLWGICSVKTSSTTGDILLAGVATIDMSAAIDGVITAGTYYLSGTTAGKLTLAEPPVGIPVLTIDNDSNVLVNIIANDLFGLHQHYKFELNCYPAGSATLVIETGPGEVPILPGSWQILMGDADVVGWLPADHASFNGKAPDGAAFGYNIAASSLANAWPPLPLAGATIEWFNGAAIVLPDLENLVQIDEYGIWWMTDVDGYQPWPEDYASTTPAGTPVMSMRLWYSRPKFYTSGSVVTSLVAKEGSVITVRCVNGADETQNTGDLEIDADLSLLLATAQDTAGYIALKGLADGKFTRGPVVSGVKAGSSNVLVTGDATDTDGYEVGQCTVTVSSSVAGYELPVLSVRLQGATEENYSDVTALGFPDERKTSYRGEVSVPYGLEVDTVNVALRFWLLARANGTLPSLTLTARVLPRPDGSAEALALTDSAVALTIPGTAMVEDTYIEVTSADIAAEPGSVIQFTLERDASAGDGFAGEIHVIRHSGVITGVV
jgi:hypothetical protein